MPKRVTKNKSTPAVFRENTRAYQAHEFLILGLTVSQIADKMHCTEENVRIMLSTGLRQMTTRMQEMREQWEVVTMHRSEWLFSLVAVALDQTDRALPPNPDLLKAAINIMKFQKDVFQTGAKKATAEATSAQTNIQINQTINTTGDLYREALASAQEDFLGYNIVPDLPPGAVVRPNEDYQKIEDLARQYLPEDAFEFVGVVDDGED